MTCDPGFTGAKKRKIEIRGWIREHEGALATRTQDLPDLLLQNWAPVNSLRVFKGFACTVGFCDYCCLKTNLYGMHWQNHHRSSSSTQADDRTEAFVQSHFKSHPRYFAVEPTLEGADPNGVIRQYMKLFKKKMATLKSDHITFDPISPTEVPPLLQETQWHTHLHKYTRSPESIKAVCQLTHLPTHKKAANDPLGDTLRQTIVLYMKTFTRRLSTHPSTLETFWYGHLCE